MAHAVTAAHAVAVLSRDSAACGVSARLCSGWGLWWPPTMRCQQWGGRHFGAGRHPCGGRNQAGGRSPHGGRGGRAAATAWASVSAVRAVPRVGAMAAVHAVLRSVAGPGRAGGRLRAQQHFIHLWHVAFHRIRLPPGGHAMHPGHGDRHSKCTPLHAISHFVFAQRRPPIAAGPAPQAIRGVCGLGRRMDTASGVAAWALGAKLRRP